MRRILLAMAASVAVTGSASAYDWRYGGTSEIDARRQSQRSSIEEGRRCGDLSWREYWYLRRREAQISAHERLATRDGYLAPYERRRLYEELAQVDREIYRLRHNDARGWWRGWY
ncbi:MAG: hypothetical protein EKK41_25710 [Hyphomicrobiales bacterium]|nr:MAG: hypothetical protein EKK41_25710 [Hyphomicrobiales bacterium]